jgi:DNA helicase HerA-like ATPase
VGVYFVTQSPADIPDMVLSQLGNRVQHALRAYTPSDQKAVRVAAQSFRANKDVDVATEIQQLNVGEALVSTLDAKGAPTPVARTKVRPPNSQVGPILPNLRTGMMAQNKQGRAYEKVIDPESAHEVLTKRAEQVAAAAAKAAEAEAREKEAAKAARSAPKTGGAAKKTTRARSSRTTAIERQSGRVASGVFNTIARELMRGILGTPKRRR